MPQHGRRKRKSSLLVPLIMVGVFLYIANKKSNEGEVHPNRSGSETHAKDRKSYDKGPEGTLMALEDGLAAAQVKERQLGRKRLRYVEEIADIEMLLREFKTAYKGAQSGSPWPVPVRGVDYNEVQLTSKVETLLALKEDREERIKLVDQEIANNTEILNGYSIKVDQFKLALAKQETARERERLKELSNEADVWVDEKVEAVAAEEEAPTGSVRSLEDLIKAEEATRRADPVVTQQALNFLKDS